jgi:nuclear RNA export factor
MKGDSVIITASAEDIVQIQKLDKFSFAGSVLSIQACDPPSPQAKKSGEKEPTVSQAAQEAKDRFRAVLAARYDANLKLLNLSALALDAGLRQMGVFDGSTTTSKVFPAMMVVCDGLFKSPQEKRDAIVSVSLADNELADVSAVTTLAQTFPDLKNLDLSRNKFTDIKNLNAWRWKFRHLENLVLTGNPIESQPTLKDELLRRYPNLQIVNGVTLRTPEEIAAAKAIAEATKSPIPIAGPDFRDVSQVGENFIRKFLPLYDNDRNALLGTFYDSQSVYSLSLNLSSPRSHEHSVPIAPWTAYMKYSRNLTKLTHLNARMSRQHKGSQAIQQVWSTLPPSRHPELESHADKYLIECHPIPGLTDPSGQSARGVDGLIITMHGEFEDQIETATEKSLRSFSRTFILGPGAPGGPQIRVVSDMLTLRAWAPLALPQISSISPETQATNDPEQQKQEAITMQLVEKTGMTPYYANLCLTETGWNIEQAFIAFTANKVCFFYNNLHTISRLTFIRISYPPMHSCRAWQDDHGTQEEAGVCLAGRNRFRTLSCNAPRNWGGNLDRNSCTQIVPHI